jgi:hypothetical protein
MTATEYTYWTNLAREAVGCEGWRWLRRMVTTTGWTIVIWPATTGLVTLPDLQDSATVGRLRELVSDAWGREIYTRWHATRAAWECSVDAVGFTIWASTEAGALVAALKACDLPRH